MHCFGFDLEVGATSKTINVQFLANFVGLLFDDLIWFFDVTVLEIVLLLEYTSIIAIKIKSVMQNVNGSTETLK